MIYNTSICSNIHTDNAKFRKKCIISNVLRCDIFAVIEPMSQWLIAKTVRKNKKKRSLLLNPTYQAYCIKFLPSATQLPSFHACDTCPRACPRFSWIEIDALRIMNFVLGKYKILLPHNSPNNCLVNNNYILDAFKTLLC